MTYALQSQQRTAKAQAEGELNDEVVPFTSTMQLTDEATGAHTYKEVTLSKDEGNRPDTSLAGLQGLQPVNNTATITAGNATVSCRRARRRA